MKFPQSFKAQTKARKVIPLGSQTFSKSHLQWPENICPLFMDRAKGSKTWDIDGNEYIDFVNGLLSISLGHCDEDVIRAVKAQLDKGTIFSLNSTLETELANMIIERVPCAEMVRFGKNGSDATAGAIRIARSKTGRDHVAVCGYHGWQDWYIGSTTRDKGVPEATKSLTHDFNYNEITSLEKLFSEFPNQIAAVILEPMNTTWPQDNFLEDVKQLTTKNGALLIFDETITGFRFSRGGAQELFGVTPELATFGKGVANGYPLSIIVGSKDIMRECEEIFFSFTMGGETLSLAAAIAVLDKMENHNTLAHIHDLGSELIRDVNDLIEKHKCSDFLKITGHPSWSFLIFNDFNNSNIWEMKTYLLQSMVEKGLLTIGTHNLSYAHSREDLEKLLQAYDEIFPELKTLILQDELKTKLKSDQIKPVFSVR